MESLFIIFLKRIFKKKSLYSNILLPTNKSHSFFLKFNNSSVKCFKSYELSQSWVSRKLPGQHHTMHTHPNSLISGVFYYGPIEENSSAIKFHKMTIPTCHRAGGQRYYPQIYLHVVSVEKQGEYNANQHHLQ